jgi:hypothetical protein
MIKVGEGFDGERLMMTTYFCDYHERLAAQKGIPSDLVPEARPPSLAEFDLVRPDPIACALWIEDRHIVWSERIKAWVQKIFETDWPIPTIGAVHAKARSAAGWYVGGEVHTCSYVLPYAMSQKDYDQTIAHEVCHAFQCAVLETAVGHDEIFEMLFRKAAGISKSERQCAAFNAYDVQQAIDLGKSVSDAIRRAADRPIWLVD